MTTQPSHHRTKQVRRVCYGCAKKLLLKTAIRLIKQPVAPKVATSQIQKSSTTTQILHFFRQIHLHFVTSFFQTGKYYSLHALSALMLTIGIFASIFWLHEYIFKDLPSPQELASIPPSVSTKILDRNGKVLYRIYEDENRTIIPLSEIPLHMVLATIAIEDQDFYEHHGFSLRGISRAVISNLEGKQVQGGSTITQQLVKNRLLSSEKTFTRKIRELILAVLVEGTYTKNEILEMYLNTVAYGGATYGIEEAAQKYFGKHARQLTIAESALIAGLPAAPSDYTPFGSSPELAYARQDEVLRRMVEDGSISPEQAITARNQNLVFNANQIDISAPHFVMYVKKMLIESFGEEVLTQGGLEVRTTLDSTLQNFAQNTITAEVAELEHLTISNGAALITNPQTGEVLAMVGSVNYFDFENDGQVNVTLRPRQPGSSIKPLTYALALTNGFTAASIIEDTPITYEIQGSKPYTPSNYDGKFHGKVTLREALASSYNIPAVKVLSQIGVDSLITTGKKLGISTWDDTNRFGLSLTLGGGEILMTELAQVYGSFAAEGAYVPLNPIIEVTNYRGETLYKNRCALEGKGCRKGQIFSDAVAYLVTSILSDDDARSAAFGLNSTLSIPNQQVAVKTGTTNNLRDNWTFGYTTDRLVAVWVGNNDNTPMSYVASGITGASPIWNTLIRSVLTDEKPHAFKQPATVHQVALCPNEIRECPYCRGNKTEYFETGTEPEYICTTVAANQIPATSTRDLSF
ncbi:MAG: transglycosylase domain-containing protein [Microgenomates group bacterium]